MFHCWVLIRVSVSVLYFWAGLTTLTYTQYCLKSRKHYQLDKIIIILFSLIIMVSYVVSLVCVKQLKQLKRSTESMQYTTR